jgi:pilus assembly protein CpaC
MTKVMRQGYGLRTFVFTTAWLIAVAIAVQAWAQPKIVIQGDETRHAGEFVVPINKSQVLQLDVPFEDLLVGNSAIADVLALTDRSIYILGKALGSTSLTIYGREKKLIAVLDLVVSPDIEGLKARLFEIMPEEKVEVRAANGALVLSGTVSGASTMDDILAVAERYAPGLVTNLMAVEGSQQVMLKVRFVEVKRTVMKDLGLNFDIFEGDFSFTSGNTFLANPTALPPGTGTINLIDPAFVAGSVLGGGLGAATISVLFTALEDKGLTKVLAEPNLIALSGDTASFLAGGEFPVQTVSEDQTQIEFKEFGVRLSFTPTVLNDGLINLIVSPEVSARDSANAVLGVPALTVRRATTTIELRDGQSFAIAGLLQEDFNDSISQIPLLGDVPVLGALFRSSSFRKEETELVIIVEVHLVKPAPIGSLATPADNFIPPSEADIWLFGRVEAPGSGVPREGGLAAMGAGGIEGHYGHIIK